MEDCKKCRYVDNCKLGLYAVNPCECVTETHRDYVNLFSPVVHKYQNPFTGKMENKPIDEYYIANPFLYPGN